MAFSDSGLTNFIQKKDDLKSLVFSALIYVFIMTIIGFPLWWKTTEVYRVPLPYDHINELEKKDIVYPIHLMLVAESSLSKQYLSELKKQLSSLLIHNYSENHRLLISYYVSARYYSSQETQFINSVSTVTELDSFIPTSLPGYYNIMLLPDNFQAWKSNFFIGRFRNIYFKLQNSSSNFSNLINIFKNVIINEEILTQLSSKNLILRHADKGSMRAVPSSIKYDIIFTLLNPQPDVYNAEWNIKQALKMYFQPFLNALKDFANFTVKSQEMFLTGLNIRPTFFSNHYKVKSKELSFILNPIEAMLGSYVDINPKLNFIVYIPSKNQAPLIIYDDNNEPLFTNAFLSPRWGGILIYNTDNVNNTNIVLDMNKVLSVFVSQIRHLLGIHSKSSNDLFTFASRGLSALSDWEYDALKSRRTIENIISATTTLTSLSQLLGEIKNIVINDDVGEQLSLAVEKIVLTHDSLSKGNLHEAFLLSKEAMQATEKAFFDPSLLALLYFPGDQKFAIYIPLFLPVSIPVVFSIRMIYRYWKNPEDE